MWVVQRTFYGARHKTAPKTVDKAVGVLKRFQSAAKILFDAKHNYLISKELK